MRATISRHLLDRIFVAAATSPEQEICGLLLGRENAIEQAVPAANVAADPACRFELDPATLFAYLRAERGGGPRLIGHYHSHPSGDTAPSSCDAAAAEPGKLWLIVAEGRVALWLAVEGGALHQAFDPAELAIL